MTSENLLTQLSHWQCYNRNNSTSSTGGVAMSLYIVSFTRWLHRAAQMRALTTGSAASEYFKPFRSKPAPYTIVSTTLQQIK